MPRTVRWGILAGLPAFVGVVMIVLQRASGVTLYDDEMGFLGEAVALSSRSGTALLTGSPFYSAGYPALLALPLSLVDVDPWVVAVVTNVVLLGALGPLLYATLRRALDVSERTAMLAAVAGAVTPSIVLQTPRAWSEVAVAVGVTLWSYLLLRFCLARTPLLAVVFGSWCGLLYGVHRRTLVLVGIGALVLVVHLVRPEGTPPQPRWGALAGLAALRAGLGISSTLDGRMVDRLYVGRTSGSRLEKLDTLTTTEWIPTLLGHLWSSLAVTVGVVGLGVVAAVLMTWRRERWLWSASIVLAFFGLVMTSVTFLGEGARADSTVYERYMAPIFPIVVALGVAALLAGRLPRVTGPAVLGALVVSGIVLDLSVGDTRLVGNVQKFVVPTIVGLNVPGVGWAETWAPQIQVLTITALTLVTGAAVLALATRYDVGAGIAVTVAFVTIGAVASAGALQPFINQWEPGGRPEAALLRSLGVDELLLAPNTRNEVRNALQYRLDYIPAVVVDLDDLGHRCGDVLVGPRGLDRDREQLVRVADVAAFPGAIYAITCPA